MKTTAEMIVEAALSASAELINDGSCAFLSRHAVAKMIRAIDPAEVLEKVGEVETTAGPWALDTSTGSEILVKGGCSVIEGEDARYLLRLIAADTSTPAPDAGFRRGDRQDPHAMGRRPPHRTGRRG